ncbi:30S ribosomal protein S16 [Paracoccus sediminicola]|uniref:30S ribosomal protein S16 n=1 Tax=Paracoccus sediminicola TaxID=3017783 RepID=UPI0022EFEFAD|nr:30S ribosomal protein S16 [Paracoccus sediminicola]WBU57734.1 30S ribosomal protein S16 [Paracoccus sediminicola]
MAMKIRLARGGSKKRPHYAIVATDSRMPRDGRFIEKLGTYNPLLPKDSEQRVQMNMERVEYWLGQGAQPTDRIARFLEAAGVREKAERKNMKKAQPGKKAQDRIKEREDKAAAAKEAEEEAKRAAEEAKNAPAEEAPADDAPAEETASE